MREKGGERRDGVIMRGKAEREGGFGGSVEVKPALGDQRN